MVSELLISQLEVTFTFNWFIIKWYKHIMLQFHPTQRHQCMCTSLFVLVECYQWDLLLVPPGFVLVLVGTKPIHEYIFHISYQEAWKAKRQGGDYFKIEIAVAPDCFFLILLEFNVLTQFGINWVLFGKIKTQYVLNFWRTYTIEVLKLQCCMLLFTIDIFVGQIMLYYVPAVRFN